RLLRRWIEKPLMSKSAIEERQEAVGVLSHQLIDRVELRAALKEIYDLERLAGRIAYGNANGRDMLALGVSLAHVPAIRTACVQSGSATLARLVSDMDDCGDIRAWIEKAIDENAPV